MDEVKFRFILVVAFVLTAMILASKANNLFIFENSNNSGSISTGNSSLMSLSNFNDAISLNISETRAETIFDSSLPENSCVEAYSIKDGRLAADPFIVRNVDKELVPASTNKYFTSAMIFSVFATDDTLDTSLVAETASASLKKAYIRTSGDPSFVSTLVPPARRPDYLSPSKIHTFDDFATQVFNSGVRSISNLVIDNKWFELSPVEAGWSDDKSEVGQISAFNVDEGFNGEVLSADPTDRAAEVLKAAFLAKGVSIGTITYSSIPDSLSAPEDVIAKTSSTSIQELVSDMLATSDNVYAEQLLAAAAHKKIGLVTKETQKSFVETALSEIGIKDVGYVFDNGSGYSTKSRATCSIENEVIVAMAKKGIDLPGLAAVSGQKGTLKTRFIDSNEIISAKTGTLDNVTALTGRISDQTQFSFIANSSFSNDEGKALQDNVVSILSSFPFVDTPKFPNTFSN